MEWEGIALRLCRQYSGCRMTSLMPRRNASSYSKTNKSSKVDKGSSSSSTRLAAHNLSMGNFKNTHSFARWPCNPLPLLGSYSTLHKGLPLLSYTQKRHLIHWTTPLPSVKEEEKVGFINAQTKEPPRITFYSSQSGHVTCGTDLNSLPEGEKFWENMTSENAEKKPKDTKPEAASSKSDSMRICYWLDIVNPSKADIQQISTKLGLHPLTVEDILGKETQEKVEVHQGYSFLSYGAFDSDPQSLTYLQPCNMYILSFASGTISLRSRRLNLPEKMERRLARLKDSILITPEWISYALIDEVTDDFGPALKPIRAECEHLNEAAIMNKDSTKMLSNISNTRKSVMILRRLLETKVEVVKALIKRHDRGPAMPRTEMSLHLSDVEDHLISYAQHLNHMEEVLSHSENTCLMQLNIQMALANNKASASISKLTVLSTVILPLNVITGLWGMNVMVPGQGVETLHWFGGLASVMVIVASSGYWWATRFMDKEQK